MMLKLRLCKILMFFAVGLIFGAFTLSNTKSSFAQSTSSSPCQIQNTYPAAMDAPVSEFGDRRGDGSRKHTGADFFYYSETNIPVPQGCVIQKNSSGNLVWEQNSKKSNGDPAGYGWYVVLDCGKPGGADTVKIRMSHVPKNAFGPGGSVRVGCSGNASPSSNRTGEMSQGCSRSGAHHHTEIIIGDRPVDPQCVLGMTKTNQNADTASANCKKCPIPPGPANLCDASVRSALINHGVDCTNNKTVAIEGGSTVDPSTISGSGAPEGGDPNGGQGDGTDGDGGHNHDDMEHTPTGGEGYTPPGIIDDDADPEAPDPPERPPEPEDPGVPGGTADLVPESVNPPEELSGCAVDTWTAMVNQAVMQTRREDILNKRFIVKPDSVIDYSCFMMFVDKVADDAGPVFSESKNWANIKVDILADKPIDVNRELGSKSLDGALMDIVESVSTNYIRGQFNNPPLAGTAPVDTATGSKNCALMSKVWKAAKCKNFDGVDVFYSFEDLMTTEPRAYPANMKCN